MNPLPGPHPRGAGPWPRQWPWPLVVCDIGTTYASYRDASLPSHNIEGIIHDICENFAMSPEYKIYGYYSENFATSPGRKVHD